MAQPDHYVKTDCSTPDHPKIHALATALNCHEVAAVGAAQTLWCRVMRHCPSGDVSAITDRTLKVWLLGFPRASWAAFVAAGLVDIDGERRVMHGWERYASKEAMRAANAERMRAARAERQARASERTNDARAAHVQRTCMKSAGAKEEEEEEEEEEVRVVEAGDTPPPFPKPSEKRADLAARWNLLAERCGLPRVRPDDAPAWASKADARIGEGLLDRWEEVAAGVAEILAEPRFSGARPKWLKFAHLVANGTNWRRLAADGELTTPAAPAKTRGQILLESVMNPDGSLPT